MVVLVHWVIRRHEFDGDWGCSVSLRDPLGKWPLSSTARLGCLRRPLGGIFQGRGMTPLATMSASAAAPANGH